MRIDEGRLPRITAVKPTGGKRVELQFDNGKTFTVNLQDLMERSRLKKLSLMTARIFARVSLGEGGHSIEWPDEVDIGADTLFQLALEQNGHADTAEFIRWRWKHGLSLTKAAEALGLSRRTIAYYSSGEEPVSRIVLLACKGWEAEQKAA